MLSLVLAAAEREGADLGCRLQVSARFRSGSRPWKSGRAWLCSRKPSCGVRPCWPTPRSRLRPYGCMWTKPSVAFAASLPCCGRWEPRWVGASITPHLQGLPPSPDCGNLLLSPWQKEASSLPEEASAAPLRTFTVDTLCKLFRIYSNFLRGKLTLYTGEALFLDFFSDCLL